jgi:4-amino-4-deoxy-L-arabinose transferase-like glycosyltransferase
MNEKAQTPAETSTRRGVELYFAISIFAVAFLLRLIYIFEISASPFFENLVIDCRRYSEWGMSIAAGDWLGDGVYYQSPLYAYFLGFVYRFVSTDLFAVRLIQAAIGAGSCVLFYAIAARLFDRRAGLLAGFLAAAYAPLIYYDCMIMKTVLSVFLAALGLLLLLKAVDSNTPGLWLACGLAWGAAALARENYLLIAAAFGIWQIIRHLRNRRTLKLRPFWLYLVGIVLVIAPVTIRNVTVSGELALVTSNLGQNLYIGNNSVNRTGAYEAPEFVVASPLYEEKVFREAAENLTGRAMTTGEVSAFFRRRALNWMSASPGPASRLMGKKFLLFFNNYEVADNQSIYFMERYSWLLELDILRFGLVAPLGIFGLVLLWRTRGKLAPLYIFGFLYAVSVIAFFVFSRYRLPIIVVLLPPAAFAVFWLIDRLRSREWKAVRVPIIVLVCLFAFAYIPTYSLRANPDDPQDSHTYHDEVMAMRFINLGQVHRRLAGKLQTEGKETPALLELRKAREAYREAKRLLPRAAEPHLYDARALTQAGHLARAEQELRIAIGKAPALASSYVAFAELLLDDRLGAIMEAREQLEEALSREPDNEEANRLYSQVSNLLADREFFEKKLVEQPNDPWALTYFAVAALFNRDTGAAFPALEKALKLNPRYVPANNAMALAFLKISEYDHAEYYARQVNELGGKLWKITERELAEYPGHHDHGEHHHDHEGE